MNSRLARIGASAAIVIAVLGLRTTEAKDLTEADRSYWVFKPVESVKAPQPVRRQAADPIDAFILARLGQAGIEPAPEADKATLIRRLYFDLTGLPPAVSDIDAFVNDPSPRAYENLVDRLLQSPGYGERQARLWLDLVRYAESDGYKADLYRPDAWRYRDYVIRAFNNDKPFDRFLQEQIAGDEMFPGEPDALVATGYLRLWPYEDNQSDIARQWDVILTDITNVTGEAILGLSFGCARCHDHKYDPILQKDYYRLQAYFVPILPRAVTTASPAEQERYRKKLAEWEAATANIRQQIDAIQRTGIDKKREHEVARFPEYLQAIYAKPADQRTPLEKQYFDLGEVQVRQRVGEAQDLVPRDQQPRLAELKTRLKQMDATKPPLPPMALTVTDVGPAAPPTCIPGHADQPVEPGVLSVLDPSPARLPSPSIGSSTTGRRAALARWLTQADNPLTARVFVNRIWQQHFGVGIVATPNDFGRQGAPPTHPGLLDWLAHRFVTEGWSVKKLHKLIVSSATYRQASLVEPSARASQIDPQNTLLWRMRTLRLEAEQVRDAMLLVGGKLDPTPAAEGVEPAQSKRSVYLKALRNRREPLLDAFDFPDTFNSCGRRSVTTTPLQSLLLINGKFTLDLAAAMAERLQRESSGDLGSLIESAYRTTCGRAPTEAERAAAMSFFNNAPRDEAFVDFCHVLLNSNALIYLD